MSEEVESSLLNCHKDRERLLEQFVSDRFMTQNGHEEPSKSFYDYVPKHNVQTMTASKSTSRFKSKDIPTNGEEMYLRLLAINAYKQSL